MVLVLNIVAFIWLYLRKYLKLSTDQLVLSTFTILSITTVLSLTGNLPGALHTKNIGALSKIYDMFFLVTVLFRLVKFKYGLSVMLVPCILVNLFQSLAVVKVDKQMYDKLPPDLRTEYFDPQTFSLNYKSSFESLVWNTTKPIWVITASYMIQIFFLEMMIQRYVATKSMRTYLARVKSGVFIYNHAAKRGNQANEQREAFAPENIQVVW